MSEAAPELTLRLVNRLEEIERLAIAVEAFGAAHNLPESVVFALHLSLDEVVTNVISYAYADVGEHPIEVRLRVAGDSVNAEVIDDGRAFNPLDVPTPDLDAPIEERRIGGLGVHLVRELMDTLEYKRFQGHNVLRLSKRLA